MAEIMHTRQIFSHCGHGISEDYIVTSHRNHVFTSEKLKNDVFLSHKSVICKSHQERVSYHKTHTSCGQSVRQIEEDEPSWFFPYPTGSLRPIQGVMSTNTLSSAPALSTGCIGNHPGPR
jgi:hypothetical protein